MCIHVGSLLYCPACLLHLFRGVPATDDAYIVSSHQRISGSESDSELWIDGEIVRRLMRAERDHDFMHIPLAALGGIHRVWPTVFVVSADNQHRLWKHPRIRFETFHLFLLFYKMWCKVTKLFGFPLAIQIIFVSLHRSCVKHGGAMVWQKQKQ